jgi:Mg2+ and Co2+ transporter CorA
MDALGISDTSQTTEKWEAEAWKSLENTLLTLKRRLDIMLEAYTQFVSIHESTFGNQQARQVGYLTSLATLLIPASSIAAIFSMDGEFAAGQAHFWVFWTMSLPIVLVASIYLCGGLVSSWLRKDSGS